jgi:hypothetical protein
MALKILDLVMARSNDWLEMVPMFSEVIQDMQAHRGMAVIIKWHRTIRADNHCNHDFLIGHDALLAYAIAARQRDFE